MTYNSIVISSGHSAKCPGASGILDEVEEATKVVDRLATLLERKGVEVSVFHDLTSTTPEQNLEKICAFHNDRERDLDVSVHFNCNQPTSKPVGTECLYLTQKSLAAEVATAIAKCGLIDRGPKYRDNLYFLNNTDMPAILIEVCFVDSEGDVHVYTQQFEDICQAIADVLGKGSDDEDDDEWPDDVRPPLTPSGVLFHTIGKCSQFGGPEDEGVSSTEDLAFFEHEEDVKKAPHLFLPYQPKGTSGLARRLNPFVHYVACRWDYNVTPKEMLVESGNVALVRTKSMALTAFPADWGPNANTGRVADLSPGLMTDLGIETDDEVEVIYPWNEE